MRACAKFLTLATALSWVAWWAPVPAFAQEGTWEREGVQYLRPDDKPAQSGDEWDWQAGWRFKLHTVSPTEISWGATHPNPGVDNTFWSNVKASWGELPAALRPGDKLALPMSVTFLKASRWTECAIRFYKGPGVDGDQRELGAINNTKQNAAATSAAYTIPSGANTLPDARLKFLVIVPEHARAIFSYRWVKGVPAAASSDAWLGDWSSNFGDLSLRRFGDRIFRTYTRHRGQCDAAVQDGKLVGTWKEAPSKSDPPGAKDDGTFELTLAKDGKSFTGSFRYAGSAKVDGAWTGKRKSE